MMKMMRRIVNLCAAAVMVSALTISNMTYAYAAMNVPIQAKFDEGITLQDSDTFTITYYNMDDETAATASVNIVANKSAGIPVEDGSYRIKSIKYNGTNQTIAEAYGITGDFSAYADLNEASTLILAMGPGSCEELEGTYDPTEAAATYNVIMDANHGEDGQPKDGYTPGLDDDIIPDEPAATTDESERNEQTEEERESDLEELDKEILGDDAESETSKPVGSGEKAVVEHYESDDEESGSGSILIRLLPLGIIFVIVMVGVYIAHKKKII